MSKLFHKITIEDIEENNCTDAEAKALLDAFEYTVKNMATTLARKSWYALEDYATSKQHGIDSFTLALERKNIIAQEQWQGIFECDGKQVKVIGTLARD